MRTSPRTRRRSATSGKKKQPTLTIPIVFKPKEQTPEELNAEVLALREKAMAAIGLLQLQAIETQMRAKRELISAAQQLLPKAKALAKTGKPRLLAVVSKIVLDRHLKFRVPDSVPDSQ